MPAPQMTDEQLRAVLYRIAQTYIEVERGLRPPDHLQRFLTPYEYRRHRAAPRPDRPRLGPVQPREMGPLHVERQGDDKISASLVTRRGDDRWSALVIHLQDRGKGWQVDHLERLERAVKTRLSRDEEPPDHHALDRRIRMVESERRLVEAAHRATATRIEDIGDRRTKASRQLTEQLDRWANHLVELERELDSLTRKQPLQQKHGLPADDVRVGAQEVTIAEQILGARPEEPEAARAWDHATEDITAYRQRWGLDAEDLIGPPTEDPSQAAERRALVQEICVYRERWATPTNSVGDDRSQSAHGHNHGGNPKGLSAGL